MTENQSDKSNISLTTWEMAELTDTPCFLDPLETLSPCGGKCKVKYFWGLFDYFFGEYKSSKTTSKKSQFRIVLEEKSKENK